MVRVMATRSCQEYICISANAHLQNTMRRFDTVVTASSPMIVSQTLELSSGLIIGILFKPGCDTVSGKLG